MLKIFTLFLCLFCVTATRGQLIIDTSPDATQMAKAIVGEGITITNITLTGAKGSYGKFKKIISNLPLDSGIVLTSGKAKTSPLGTGLDGVATTDADNNNNAPGDLDLNRLINGTTNDACVLEFDFVPIGDSVKFRYVFSSDEYPTYNCSRFNDVFAFLISGPGIPGKVNIALVPGTNIPVAINSVNNGVAGPGEFIDTCRNMGAGSPFTQYYTDNSAGTTLTHNGFTHVFTAIAAVEPCQTYHLKLAIADVSDEILDSGVFLEAGSLNSAGLTIIPQFPVDALGTPFMAEGCHTGSFKVRLPRTSTTPTTVSLQYSGTATYGVDYNPAATSLIIPPGQLEATVNMNPIVDNLPEGTELVKIYVLANCSNALPVDSLIMEIRDYDTLQITPRLSYLCNVGNTVNLQAGGAYTTYSWTPAATLSNPGIRNPVATPVQPTIYIVTANLGNCNARDSAVVRFKAITRVVKKDIFCAGASDGNIQLGGNPGWAYPLQFSINGGAYQADSLFTNLPKGNYLMRIRDAAGCVKDSIVQLIQAYPDLQTSFTTTKANCNGINGTATFTTSGGRPPYRYSADGINFQPGNSLTLNAGNYSIRIFDANDCALLIPVTITSDPPLLIQYTATRASCSGAADAQVTVTASGGSGNYTYALDNGAYQTSNILSAISGPHTINVLDASGCAGTLPATVLLNNTVTVDTRPDTTICEGRYAVLNTFSNAASFIWSPPTALSNPGDASPTATPNVTTQYFILASTGVCFRFDSVTVTVRPAPIPDAGQDTTICFGGTATLHASGGVAYLWQPVQLFSSPTAQNPSLTLFNSRQFKVRVTDGFGCNSLYYDSVFVTVLPKIIAFAGRDTTVAINQPLQLQASGSLYYLWTPATGLNNPTIANPVATLQNDINYTVTVSDDLGCFSTAGIKVKTYKGPEIYVPTAFTPNGDGRNDILKPYVIGFKTFDYFRIYNRWGELVFATSDYRQGWNGIHKGLPQSLGTFVWMARGTAYTGQVIERRGSFILVR